MVGPRSLAVASEWFSLPSHAEVHPGSVPAVQAGLRRHLGSCSAHLAGTRRWHGLGPWRPAGDSSIVYLACVATR
eukprot:1672743-Pyramimonas_sp.AAC.1